MEGTLCLNVLIWECLSWQESVGTEIWHFHVFVASLVSTEEMFVALNWHLIVSLRVVQNNQRTDICCSWEPLFVSVIDQTYYKIWQFHLIELFTLCFSKKMFLKAGPSTAPVQSTCAKIVSLLHTYKLKMLILTAFIIYIEFLFFNKNTSCKLINVQKAFC